MMQSSRRTVEMRHINVVIMGNSIILTSSLIELWRTLAELQTGCTKILPFGESFGMEYLEMVIWFYGILDLLYIIRVIQPSGNVVDMRGPNGSLVF